MSSEKKRQCRYCEKYKAIREPKSDCEDCWRRYFTAKLSVLFAARAIVNQFGYDMVVMLRGKHFAKNYKRFEEKYGHLIA